jgi:hypothetical protein
MQVIFPNIKSESKLNLFPTNMRILKPQAKMEGWGVLLITLGDKKTATSPAE